MPLYVALLGPVKDVWAKALVNTQPAHWRVTHEQSRNRCVKRLHSQDHSAVIVGAVDNDNLPGLPLVAEHMKIRPTCPLVLVHDGAAAMLPSSWCHHEWDIIHLLKGDRSHYMASLRMWDELTAFIE